MEIDDVVAEEYAPKIGATALAVYVIMVYRKGKIGLQEIGDRLGITLPTVLKARDILIEYKLIAKKNEDKRKNFETMKYEKQKTQSITAVKNFDRLTYLIYNIILSSILSHPRYKGIKVSVLSKKIRESLTNLVVHGIDTEAKTEAMCKWWMAAKKHLRFSFGLFCCDGMIDEFRQLNKSMFKSTPIVMKTKNDEFLKEVLHEILAKRKRGEKLDEEENAILSKHQQLIKEE